MNKWYKILVRAEQVTLLISAVLFIVAATQGQYDEIPIAIMCVFGAWYLEYWLKGVE